MAGYPTLFGGNLATIQWNYGVPIRSGCVVGTTNTFINFTVDGQDMQWINAEHDKLNAVIRHQVGLAVASGVPVLYVSPGLFTGHGLCDYGTPYVNRLIIKNGQADPGSFHPNISGQSLGYAAAFRQRMDSSGALCEMADAIPTQLSASESGGALDAVEDGRLRPRQSIATVKRASRLVNQAVGPCRGTVAALTEAASVGMPVDADIPYWYNTVAAPDGGPLDLAVMRVASSVTIMAYRNNATAVLKSRLPSWRMHRVWPSRPRSGGPRLVSPRLREQLSASVSGRDPTRHRFRWMLPDGDRRVSPASPCTTLTVSFPRLGWVREPKT